MHPNRRHFLRVGTAGLFGLSLADPPLGALAAKLLPPASAMPPYVLFDVAKAAGHPSGAGYLGTAYAPFDVEGSAVRPDALGLPDGFTPKQLADRKKLRDQFD